MRTIHDQHEFESWWADQPRADELPPLLNAAGMARDEVRDLTSQQEEPLTLGQGIFEVDDPEPHFLNVRGVHRWYTQIRAHQPLRLSHISELHNLTVRTMGARACLNVDRAAYANFESVWFLNMLPPQDHEQMVFADIQTRGMAIEATPAHDGDNSYAVRAHRCYFAFLEYGLQIAASQVNHKGFIQLEVSSCFFNACAFPVHGERIGEASFTGGLMQLHKEGVWIDGNFNTCFRMHFERGGGPYDIHIAPGSRGKSYGNLLLWNDAPSARILDEGDGTILKLGHNRNMANPVDGSGKKKKKPLIASKKHIVVAKSKK